MSRKLTYSLLGHSCQFFAVLICLILFFLESKPAYSDITVNTLPDITISEFNTNTFSTPIAFFNNAIYVVNIIPPNKPLNSVNLKTVVSKINLSSKQKIWDSKVLESNTMQNKYHTQASIGIDKLGHIHVAYNMHNTPWQYSISEYPENIESFKFFGQEISMAQKLRLTKENKASFPTSSDSLIPGTQITYPRFYNDKLSNLYITYRYGLNPESSMSSRIFAGGIAKYNHSKHQWKQIGRNIVGYDSSPFTYSPNWVVYLPTIAFDSKNQMHVAWSLRSGSPGRNMSKMHYGLINSNYTITDTLNNTYKLPLLEKDSLNILSLIDKHDNHFATVNLSIDKFDQPNIIYTSIKSKSRKHSYLNHKTRDWSVPKSMPRSASSMIFTEDGTAWAFATGPKIYTRKSNHSTWKELKYKGDLHHKYGYIKSLHIKQKKLIFLYTQRLDDTVSRIFYIQY